MKFKKIIIVTLFLFAIFTISSVSANENVTDDLQLTEFDEIKNPIEVTENADGESSTLIGYSKDNPLSREYVIQVDGPSSIERGEVAKFTIRDSQYGIGWSDGINITITDFKGETCFSYHNYKFHSEVQNLQIDTSNLIAGEYVIYITVANPNDSINNCNKYIYVKDSEHYGSYSPNDVKTLAPTFYNEYNENEDVKIYVELQDFNNNPLYGYVDIYVDGKYYKRMDINQAKQTLNLGKLKIGKHTIRVQVKSNFYIDYEISVIKDSPSKSTSSLLSVSAPSVTAYYKANKYFKVTVKKYGKAVKNLKLTLKVYTGNKIKTYTIKTNNNGVASFNTNKLSIGTHKVVVSSSNKNYKFTKTSKITVKKKSSTATVKDGKYKNINSITVTVKDGSKTIKVKCVYNKSHKQYLGSVYKYGKTYSVYVAYESKNGMQHGKIGWWTSGTNAGMDDNAKIDTRYNKNTPVTTLSLH